jgi:8-oxo-dGTP pyrophosphatase MutT (NUDIX family)
MNSAACILIIENNKVLAVSRKYDLEDFNLPGGAVEEGETFAKAAIRELKQETGLYASNLSLVFWDYNKDWLVKTFVPATYSGTIYTTEKGKVDFIDFGVLIAGSFGEYNKKLLKHLRLI